jgi:hypothetical protein
MSTMISLAGALPNHQSGLRARQIEYDFLDKVCGAFVLLRNSVPVAAP